MLMLSAIEQSAGEHRKRPWAVEGYLAHKKQRPPRTLQQDCLGPYGGPREGGCFV